MKRYLTKAVLEKYLALIPKSVSIGVSSGGFEAVTGVFGYDCLDLSRLKDPIFWTFANVQSTNNAIANFTARYGVLDFEGRFSDYDVEMDSKWGKEFSFPLEIWRLRQRQFRSWWLLHASKRGEELMHSAGRATHFPHVQDDNRFLVPTCFEGVTELIWRGPRFSWTTSNGRLGVNVSARTLWQYVALQMLFTDLGVLRKCENEKCPTPFFVSRRGNQVFCSSDCAERVAKKRWWDRHGLEWRRKRTSKR
ncbi:MAG TPA: hypothetical protein VKD70_10300 [Candidatus Acidoferrum sp.]|nr:hypothetical protein [Candidatus Acidoferrum sp.]